MATTRTTILGFLMFTALAAGIAADRGNLVVDNYGKLLLISTDGQLLSLARLEMRRLRPASALGHEQVFELLSGTWLESGGSLVQRLV